MLSSAPFWF